MPFKPRPDRRTFLKSSLATAAAASAWPGPGTSAAPPDPPSGPPRIKFAAIGLNHGHINGQVDAVQARRGRARRPSTRRRPTSPTRSRSGIPEAKLAASEQEILEDPRSSSW